MEDEEEGAVVPNSSGVGGMMGPDDDDDEDEDGVVEGESQVPPSPALQQTREGGGKRKRKTTTRVGSGAMGSVVKVFVVRAKLSYKMPWQRKAPKNSSGSGFTIHPRRVLTNAHVVEDSTTIIRHGNPKRFVARVVCIGYQCDIALLEVDDEAFWAGYTPLQFGDVPHLQESVTCVGYPTGGDNISVTCGVVSRVDVQVYVNRYTSLLAVQIDAAINSGNSGGPVFLGKKVVGIAFSRRLKAQNIGLIIPVPVIQRFLTEFDRHGKVTFIEPGLTIAKMESLTLRKYYGMNDDQCGVLMAIDGVRIADDGTISFRGDERIGAEHLFGIKYPGDTCTLTVLRRGQSLDVATVLRPTIPLIPKLHGFDSFASYFIVGGLVFCPLSVPFLHGWYGASWQARTPSSLLWHYSNGLPSRHPPEEGPEQVVILAQILASPVTVGYRAGGWCVRLKRFNGVTIHNMRQLVNLVEAFLAQHKATLQRQEEEEQSASNAAAATLASDLNQPSSSSETAQVTIATTDDTTQRSAVRLEPAQAPVLLEGEDEPKAEEHTAAVVMVASPGVAEPEASKEQDKLTAEPEKEPRDCNAPPHASRSSSVSVGAIATAFLRFDVGERDHVIVLDTDHVVREESAILTTHSIARHKSPDV